MKNKKIRCERREGIQARKEIYFPFLNKNGVQFKLNAAQFLLLPPSERKDVIVELTAAIGADIEGHILYACATTEINAHKRTEDLALWITIQPASHTEG